MSEESTEKLEGSDPVPRKRRWRARLRPYFETWLLAFFVTFSLIVVWHIGQIAEAKPSDAGVFKALIVAPIVALTSLPAMWLLRIFREASPSTWLRCLRRLLLGMVCGAFPAALLSGLVIGDETAKAESASVIWMLGFVYGLIAGLVDAMHLDLAVLADPMRDDAFAA